jgi:hypothetical protein
MWKMYAGLVLVGLVVAIVPLELSGQRLPEDGTFVKICDMHGEANSGEQAWHKDDRCNLPRGFSLDKSYHQSSANFVGGGASTNLSSANVPAGIHVEVTGNHYWSIVAPMELVRIDDDDDAAQAIRQFRVHTYCGPAGRPGPGCSVHVAVYARRRQ